MKILKRIIIINGAKLKVMEKANFIKRCDQYWVRVISSETGKFKGYDVGEEFNMSESEIKKHLNN